MKKLDLVKTAFLKTAQVVAGNKGREIVTRFIHGFPLKVQDVWVAVRIAEVTQSHLTSTYLNSFRYYLGRWSSKYGKGIQQDVRSKFASEIDSGQENQGDQEE